MDTPVLASVRSLPRVGARAWLVMALCLVPVFTAPVLPLVDFYAHALRYAILADAGRDPWLAENYRSAWSLLPNLGLDILGVVLFRVLPALVAARIVVLVAIAAPFVGVLVLARCLHGRVTPLAVVLAGILAHSFILGWGFANFLLGLGLALAALGLWIALEAAPARQLAVAVAAGVVIFLTHGFVFALWGLCLAAVELPQAIDGGRRGLRRLPWRLFRLSAVAALPVLLFLASATAGGEGGVTAAAGHIAAHLRNGSLAGRLLDEVALRLDGVLRVAESGWPVADRIFGLALWGLLGFGLATGRLRLDRRLRFVAALAALLALAVPPGLFGVGHLPERLPLVLLAVLAAGTEPAPAGGGRIPRALSVLLPLHLLMVTIAWTGAGESYRAFLKASEDLPGRLLAAPAFAAEARDRDRQRACKPLTFLLGLERGIAVPTFANPTQQPLRITGPLAAAMATADARAAADPGLSGAAEVRALFASGFDLVVLCHAPQAAAPAITGAGIIGAGRGWALYRREGR